MSSAPSSQLKEEAKRVLSLIDILVENFRGGWKPLPSSVIAHSEPKIKAWCRLDFLAYKLAIWCDLNDLIHLSYARVVTTEMDRLRDSMTLSIQHEVRIIQGHIQDGRLSIEKLVPLANELPPVHLISETELKAIEDSTDLKGPLADGLKVKIGAFIGLQKQPNHNPSAQNNSSAGVARGLE